MNDPTRPDPIRPDPIRPDPTRPDSIRPDNRKEPVDQTQSFFGATAREALSAVKHAIGDDAVILDTREVLTRGHRRYEVRVSSPQQELLSPPRAPFSSTHHQTPDNDLPPTVARRLFERCRRIETTGATSTAAFEQALGELVSVVRPPWESTTTRRVIAFIGPTGGGKTTTLAKVAAQGLLANKKVALVTTDTWRVGAVQHLARYAEILGVPCYVAGNDGELQRALLHARGVDLLLIDTAGRSPADAVDTREAARLRLVPQAEAVLVVPASTPEKQLLRLRSRFASFDPLALAVTKVDEGEGEGGGGVVGCAALLGLPLCALTDGQDVPDHIHAVSARSLLARLSGTGVFNGR